MMMMMYYVPITHTHTHTHTYNTQEGDSSAPILLWLQGGPGGSSLFGLFNENGPVLVDKEGDLKARPWTWNTKYHMLYIDNPVSTHQYIMYIPTYIRMNSCPSVISNLKAHVYVHTYIHIHAYIRTYIHMYIRGSDR